MPLCGAKLALNAHNLVACINNSLESGLRLFPRVLLSRIRGQDVQLLKTLQVEFICDLMVEKKKSKYGLM